MKQIIGSVLLVAGFLLCSTTFGSPAAPPNTGGAPNGVWTAQGIALDPAAQQRIAEYRAHPERAGETVPPMYVEPYTGPLKPRRITAKDFYLNLLDVSNLNGIVVKFTEEAMIRWRDGKPYSKNGADVKPIFDFLARHPGVVMDRNDPLHSEELFDYWEANGERNTGQDLANLNNFYEFYIPENPNPLGLIQEILAWDIVETAWYVPKWALACTDVPPTTPLWEANQDYLDPAPLGIDAQYAWSYSASFGRGRSGYWCIDVEGSWTEDHEDLPSSFSVLEGGDHGGLGDHGDAVVGIIAACNNSYGMTGICSNVTPHAISWPWQAGATDQDRWITAFNAADAWLLTGESYMIEIHYPGPDPGYSCDTVCDNCGQFRYIPVEYWDNVFTAIQTHTANGIVVYEAAGNGQMNLDNAVYGNRFQRWFRDSGAILVGAGIPNTRVGECWSNYGSRCDLQGWGQDVYTLGYGNLWAGSVEPDRTQWYTGWFSGTSSATPIVTGAGNILQGISQGKYGITRTPANIRSYLSVTGTAWAGTHDVGERPNLAAAINYIEPDITYYRPTMWSYPLVPRNTTGATVDTCLITASLDGNTNNTYVSIQGINNGLSPAPDCTNTQWHGVVRLDSATIWYYNVGRIQPNQRYWGGNWGAVTVRGGRHSWRFIGNYDHTFEEYSETNNAYTRQFVWSPLVMSTGVVYTRSAPPLKTYGSPSYYNGDGLRASGGWWLGVAVLPQTGNDVDLYSFNPAYTCTTGFDASLRGSAYGSGYPDFVLTNGNRVGYNPTRNYQAVRYSDASTDDYRAEADTSRPAWYAPFDTTDYLASTEIFDMYEIYLYSGNQYYIGVSDITSTLDLKLSVYHKDSTELAYSQYLWYSNNAGAGGAEYVIVTPGLSGYYAAVVMKSTSAGWGVGGWYTFRYETPPTPNLSPTPVRTGWDAPLVVRHTSDATGSSAAFPAALVHDAFCYYNSAWINKGTGPCVAGYTSQIGVDGAGLFDLNGVALNPFAYDWDINDGPWLGIRGGRHTISLSVDDNGAIAESNEADNYFAGQYVWSPLPLAQGVGLGRFAPPNHGSGGYYNNDGFSFDPSTNCGSAAGVLPTGVSSDYDMYVYSDYVGTFNGYSNLIGASTYGSNVIDYVYVPYRLESTYNIYYPAAINWNGASDAMFVEAEHTLGRISYVDTWSKTDSIMNDNILNPYEFPMTAGTPYVITMHMIGGSSDLELRLFRDSLTVSARPSAVAVANMGGMNADEQLTYTPAVSDYYALIVAKTDANSGGLPVWYQLNAGADNPLPVTNLRADYWESPLGLRLSWRHVNSTQHGLPLSGRRYVIYRNTTVSFVPQPSDSIGQTTDSIYVDPNPFGTVRYFYAVKVKSN
jgi:serine protease